MSATKLQQTPRNNKASPEDVEPVKPSASTGTFRMQKLRKHVEAHSGRSVGTIDSRRKLQADISARSMNESKASLFSRQTIHESPTANESGRDDSVVKVAQPSQSKGLLLSKDLNNSVHSVRSINRSASRLKNISASRSKLKFGLSSSNNKLRSPPPSPPRKTPMPSQNSVSQDSSIAVITTQPPPGAIKVTVNPFQTTLGMGSLRTLVKENLRPSPTEVNFKNNKFFALSGTSSNSDTSTIAPPPMFQNNNILSCSDSTHIKTPRPPNQTQNRHEMLAQLRHKLREIQRQEVSASGRKRTVAAAAATAGGIDGAGCSSAALGSQSARDKLLKQFQPNKPKTLEEVIQDSNTRSIKFLDIIILCTVLDNYIFGALIFVAAIAEIIIGWLYLNSCSTAPYLPTLLILNGSLNILEVYTRNLANNGKLDYFIMTFFRLLAFFSFVILMIMVFTVDPKVVIWNPPADTEYYVSIGGIQYCQTVLYYFSYYLVIFCASMIALIALFGLICIIYMNNRARAESNSDSSHLSYHRYDKK